MSGEAEDFLSNLGEVFENCGCMLMMLPLCAVCIVIIVGLVGC